MKFRKETDSMGSISVPDDKYWGASTERSKKYFDIGNIFVNKTLINAIAIIKLAAAKVHKKDKQIEAKICDAIVKASKEIVTGKLDGISRAEAKSLIEQNSGSIISNVSKKLNYLIVGEKPTKRKIESAKELQIKILNQVDWLKMLNKRG